MLKLPFKSHWRAFAYLLITAFLSSITLHSVRAADKYKADDEIEVLFLGKWYPATLVDQDKRGNVMVDFEFAAAVKRQTFKANEVRFAYESGAIAPGRMWSDPSGSFKMKGALITINKDDILLRKPDKSEITVPLAKLSQGDQDFVKRLKKEMKNAGLATATKLPVEDFDTSVDSIWAVWGKGGDGERTAIEPDPLPSYLKLQEGGVGFPNLDFFDRLGAVLPLGGNDSWVLASMENGKPSGERPTRLVWASLVKKKVMGQQALLPGEVVLDYHQPSKQLLTFNDHLFNQEGEPPTLTLWKVAPTDEDATPVARWNASKDKHSHTDPWARIIDADTVLHRWDRGEFVVWDIPGKRIKYKLPQESFFAPDPVVSWGRRYIYLPEDRNVRIIEAATGSLLCSLPAPQGSSAVAPTEDGRRLAVLNQSKLTIWDLTNPSAEPEVFAADAIGTPFRSTLEWLGPDHIMADSFGGSNKVLFSLKHGVALWNYHFDMSAVPERGSRRVRTIVAGHLAYAATVRAGKETGLAVGAVKLPGPKVADAAKTLNTASLMIVKRGTAMRVEVNAGDNGPRVSAALQKILDTNGWTYDPNAEAVMIADMKRGEQQQVSYRSFGGGGEQIATVTPFISGLRIEVNKKAAWQSGTSTGAPPVMHLRNGETVQGEIDKWQHPDVEFFERVVVPEQILDPDKRNGLGTTDVTLRGLVPR